MQLLADGMTIGDGSASAAGSLAVVAMLWIFFKYGNG